MKNKLKRPTKFLFVALPNAGKGSVIKKLDENFPVSILSMGELCRNEVKNGTEIGKQIEQQRKMGFLAPDSIIIPLALNTISKANTPVVLCDGFPINLAQAKALIEHDNNLVVIEIAISAEEVRNRSFHREICPNCGAIYSTTGEHRPMLAHICDKCHYALVQRDDDTNLDIVNTRIDVYYKDTYPVLDFFRKNGIKVHTITGYDSVHVYSQVSEIVKPFI